MIKLGNNSIGKIYLGSNSIGKAYLGSNLVFQKGGSPTPTDEPVFYDYLVWDGVAKIETDYVLPQNCSIRVALLDEKNKAAQRVFHATGGDGLIQMIYGSATTSASRTVNVYYDSTSLTDSFARSFSYTLYFWMTPNRCGFGGTGYQYNKGSSHPTGGLVFGGWDSGNPFSGKMGAFGVYGTDAQNASSWNAFDNYTPIATFKPCIYNGEAGFWYVEGNKFFGNTAGAGQLTVANEE